MAGKLQKNTLGKVVCSSAKPALGRPRINCEVNINLSLGVRECGSLGLIAATRDKRPVEDSCERGN